MKYTILLSSLFLLVSAAANAHEKHNHSTPETERSGLTLSGFLNFGAAAVDEDLETTHSNPVFYNDTEVHVKYLGVSDRGFRYGAVVELEADASEDAEEQGLNADKTYLFFESRYGRVELGANTDAGSALSVNSSTFATATGGTHGDWWHIAAFPMTSSTAHGSHDSFMHKPALPLHHMHEAAEDANKLTYYTPRFNGFQAGFSFSPDSGDSGSAGGFSGKSGHHDFNDVLNGGVNYSGKIGDWQVIASLAGERGRAELPGHENLAAYTAGLNLSYKGFIVGGSYGDWGTSENHTSPTLEDGGYWDVGAGYSWDAYAVSLGYFSSEFRGNEVRLISLGADYKLAPGLMPYAEVTRASLDAASTTVADNDATVFMLGVKLGF